MLWPFEKKAEDALIHSFETGLRVIQVCLCKKLESQYSATMAGGPACVLAAQVVNYLKGEDVMAVMEHSTEPLRSEIDRIKDQIPESAARAMAESGSTREVVVATLRMRGALEFMRQGESYLLGDQHQRIYKLLSTYGAEFPEEINPSRYLEMAQRCYEEHFGLK
jgi:hypothetical protein